MGDISSAGLKSNPINRQKRNEPNQFNLGWDKATKIIWNQEKDASDRYSVPTEISKNIIKEKQQQGYKPNDPFAGAGYYSGAIFHSIIRSLKENLPTAF